MRKRVRRRARVRLHGLGERVGSGCGHRLGKERIGFLPVKRWRRDDVITQRGVGEQVGLVVDDYGKTQLIQPRPRADRRHVLGLPIGAHGLARHHTAPEVGQRPARAQAQLGAHGGAASAVIDRRQQQHAPRIPQPQDESFHPGAQHHGRPHPLAVKLVVDHLVRREWLRCCELLAIARCHVRRRHVTEQLHGLDQRQRRCAGRGRRRHLAAGSHDGAGWHFLEAGRGRGRHLAAGRHDGAGTRYNAGIDVPPSRDYVGRHARPCVPVVGRQHGVCVPGPAVGNVLATFTEEIKQLQTGPLEFEWPTT
eukprot:scaffold15447_cov123-Isochrysis_galbana.AAC.1